MAEDDLLDARQAAELLRRSADHARQRLMVNQPLIYGAWGAAWLIGCGAMWLSVLGQHPFRGAAGWASAVLGVQASPWPSSPPRSRQAGRAGASAACRRVRG